MFSVLCAVEKPIGQIGCEAWAWNAADFHSMPNTSASNLIGLSLYATIIYVWVI